MNNEGAIFDGDGKQVAAVMPGEMRLVGADIVAVVNGIGALITPHAERLARMRSRWQRAPEHDTRTANGDDHAGDGWRNRQTGEIRIVAVDYDVFGYRIGGDA